MVWRKGVYVLSEIGDLIDWLEDNREEVLSRRERLPKLIRLTRPKENGPIRGSYRNLVYREYQAIELLYSMSVGITFYPQILDSCRKIVELLIRYELETPLNTGEYGISRMGQVSWAPEDKILARKVFGLTSLSVHTLIMKLWEKTRSHSKIDYSGFRRDLLKFSSEEEADRHVAEMQAQDGMEGFTLEIISNTVQLSNKVIR